MRCKKEKLIVSVKNTTRHCWGNVNPCSRVHNTPKKYSRKTKHKVDYGKEVF